MRSLGALVGAGYDRAVRVTDRWEFWLDEDGMAAGKAVNQAAMRVARAFGAQFSLCGTIVITVLDDGTASAALSPGQFDAILRRITVTP